MKKIIINGRFLLHRTTGVERYARELLAGLVQLIHPGEVEMAVPPETKEIPAHRNIKVNRVGKLDNRLWEHICFLLFLVHGSIMNGSDMMTVKVSCTFKKVLQTQWTCNEMLHQNYYKKAFGHAS